VYAVCLAVLLLDEQRELTPSFYLGVAIVLAVVFGHQRRQIKPSPATG
jgi:hypothetical protein